MTDDRAHDVVLFGATGYTGGLTAEYLARNAPAECSWALAGRNRPKLESLRERLARENPACAELPLLHADVTDAASLRELAGSTKVVITTVGPYITYGEPLVAACAEAGTAYVDLTGEPEFVDLMYVRHHARAVETGARIVHCCGFDSIPTDLGAYFTVGQLPADARIQMRGYVRAGGRFSGGTFQSAVTGFSRARGLMRAASERRRIEPRAGGGRQVRAIKEAPKRADGLEAWALPFPAIDVQVVLRSARALERYGPDFSYGHYLAFKRAPVAAGVVAGAAGLLAAAQVPPARDWLLKRMESGAGPTPEQRAKGWFRTRFVASAGAQRVVCEVSGGDPGYGDTAKMLAESALCLALDDLPVSAGQVTTAVAMGDALIPRLERAGIEFRVLERAPR